MNRACIAVRRLLSVTTPVHSRAGAARICTPHADRYLAVCLTIGIACYLAAPVCRKARGLKDTGPASLRVELDTGGSAFRAIGGSVEGQLGII
jgi:hypothetical protein